MLKILNNCTDHNEIENTVNSTGAFKTFTQTIQSELELQG